MQHDTEEAGELTVHAAYSSTVGERAGEDARMASTTQLVVQGAGGGRAR
jgi:hypothetical protein